MGEGDLSQPFEPRPCAQAIGRRRPLAAPVEGHHRRPRERRGVEGARRVRQVVLDEVPAVRAVGAGAAEPRPQVVGSPVGELTGCVDDRGEEERVPRRLPLRGRGVCARLQRQGDRRLVAVVPEEQEGIVRVGDVVNLDEADTGLAQAVVDRVVRQLVGGEGDRSLAVLDAGEALLLGRRHHPSVHDQARRGVVVDRVDAERVHPSSPPCRPWRVPAGVPGVQGASPVDRRELARPGRIPPPPPVRALPAPGLTAWLGFCRLLVNN